MTNHGKADVQAIVDRLLIVLFAVGIFLPIIGMVLPGGRPTQDAFRPVKFPTISLSSPRTILSFPGLLKVYFEENFGFRDRLIRWHGLVKMDLLHVTSSPRVILGKDGWLFFSAEGSLEGLRRMHPFTRTELARWARAYNARNAWLSKQGIHYFIVVVPDKHTVYPEYLPNGLTQLRKDSRLDQFVTYMKGHSAVKVLDLRDAELAAKRQGDLYYKTDAHWNYRGALAGYQQIAKQLHEWYPGLEAPDVSMSESLGGPGDLARVLGMDHRLRNQFVKVTSHRDRPVQALTPSSLDEVTTMNIKYVREVITECPGAEIPRLVVLRDSSANAIVPLLSENAQRAVYVWANPLLFPQDVIERERPQVVIQFFIERKLMLDDAPELPKIQAVKS